jgi:hypothetical protein
MPNFNFAELIYWNKKGELCFATNVNKPPAVPDVLK